MTIPARTIAQLARLALSDEQAEAVATMLRDVEEATKAEANAALEGRRAADRKRKQDERERQKLAQDAIGHVTSRDVTGRPVTSTDTPAEPTDTVFSNQDKSPPSPPKGGTSPVKKSKKPVGSLCPEDLRASDGHYLKCRQRGVPDHVADQTVAGLMSWSHENAHREVAYKTDWHRAVHRALDDEIAKFKRQQASPRAPPGPAPAQRMTGLAKLGHMKAQARRSGDRDEPALDLQSNRAQTPDPACDPWSDPVENRDHDESPSGNVSRGSVHDFPRSRAFG